MNTGVIGAGHWGNILINNFDEVTRAIDPESMVYYYDPYVKLDGYIGFGDITDLFNNSDIIVVATPAEYLQGNAEAALRWNKPIFCEKPILNRKHFDSLYNIASENKLTCFIDNLYLYNI